MAAPEEPSLAHGESGDDPTRKASASVTPERPSSRKRAASPPPGSAPEAQALGPDAGADAVQALAWAACAKAAADPVRLAADLALEDLKEKAAALEAARQWSGDAGREHPPPPPAARRRCSSPPPLTLTSPPHPTPPLPASVRPLLGAKIDEMKALERDLGGDQLTEAVGGATQLFDDYEALNERRNGEVLDFMSKHIAVANAQRAFKAAEARYQAAAKAYRGSDSSDDE